MNLKSNHTLLVFLGSTLGGLYVCKMYELKYHNLGVFNITNIDWAILLTGGAMIGVLADGLRQ